MTSVPSFFLYLHVKLSPHPVGNVIVTSILLFAPSSSVKVGAEKPWVKYPSCPGLSILAYVLSYTCLTETLVPFPPTKLVSPVNI